MKLTKKLHKEQKKGCRQKLSCDKSQLSKPLTDSKLRLFVDPASYSTGWALFRGSECRQSGTITADGGDIGLRLARIARVYWCLYGTAQLPNDNTDLYIELIPGTCSYYVQWSVGAILANLCCWRRVKLVGRVAPKAWQKTVDWTGNRMLLSRYKVGSEDELAAIGMGIHVTSGGKVSAI